MSFVKYVLILLAISSCMSAVSAHESNLNVVSYSGGSISGIDYFHQEFSADTPREGYAKFNPTDLNNHFIIEDSISDISVNVTYYTSVFGNLSSVCNINNYVNGDLEVYLPFSANWLDNKGSTGHVVYSFDGNSQEYPIQFYLNRSSEISL